MYFLTLGIQSADSIECYACGLAMIDPIEDKVEIVLKQREVPFLSPSKICKNLNFSRKIQIFANFVG